MTNAFFASLSSAQPLAWLQQALSPLPRPTVRTTSQEVRHLRKGESLVIETANGRGVVCLEGALWIVHDDEPSDSSAAGVQPVRQRMTVRALAHSRLCLPTA
jgi:hypothetical protein